MGHEELGGDYLLDVPIREIILTRHGNNAIRKSVLCHDFFQRMTLRDVLETPEAVLKESGFIPKLGAKTLAALKLLISDEFASLFGEEWAMADPRRGQPTAPDKADLVEKLAEVRRLFSPALDTMHMTADYHSEAFSDRNLIYEDAFIRYHNSDFIYVPVTIPEPLKTPAVLAADSAQSGKPGYVKRMQDLLQEVLGLPMKGRVLIDENVLRDLALRKGRYSVLSEQDARDQIAILRTTLGALDFGLRAFVVNLAKDKLSTGFVGGNERVYIYTLGGYLVIDDPSFVRVFRLRANAACRAGTDVLTCLDQL